MSQDESMKSLRQLVCGGTDSAKPKSDPAPESKDTCHSHNGHVKLAVKQAVKPAGLALAAASPELAGRQQANPVSAEHTKLQQLHRKLGDALQHMTLGVESLDEANQLNGNQLKAVRSCLAGLLGQVKRQFDEAEKRATELETFVQYILT